MFVINDMIENNMHIKTARLFNTLYKLKQNDDRTQALLNVI